MRENASVKKCCFANHLQHVSSVVFNKYISVNNSSVLLKITCMWKQHQDVNFLDEIVQLTASCSSMLNSMIQYSVPQDAHAMFY